ncbi:MAG TPA: prepilin-type N-terminal cleavage/methylation domain-containing protein [Methylotenera sp.]|nr:prepilin-type N-terminal cleavage/methylation domain-containing protein [Methylotenera sp.]
MKKQQTGFTLIELAIVLVIIGLLLGGVLKGQELINSAKVKNMSTDFRNIPVYIYGYQDKFKALPGDDRQATAHNGSTTQGNGNGQIEGVWNSEDEGEESVMFWEHVRKAGLAPGGTDIADAADTGFYPTNADGGRVGVSTVLPIQGQSGAYFMCSAGILGKYAKQIDTTIDDGLSNGGSLRATEASGADEFAEAGEEVAEAYEDGTSYTLCMGF